MKNHLRFVAVFLAWIAAFQIGLATEVADRWIEAPLCRLVARLVAWLLAPFGAVTLQEGTRLGFDGFQVLVVDACNGLLPTTIYLAAVLAFPTSWRARGLGVLLGVPAIFLVNLVRVASLLVLGAYWPAAFERVHLHVWQTLVVALSMAIWIFWAELFVRPQVRSGARA